jgi:hypothetical protein
VKAVAVSMGRALHHMGLVRTARTLQNLDQTDGFDCRTCAWHDPDPERRHKGIGKASVTLTDVYNAELIIMAGQNPGSTPWMLSAPVLVRTRLAPWPRRTHPAHRTPGAILRMRAES